MYAKHKKEFVKLTIRCDIDDLDRFKKICKICGQSANNQINILMKKYNYENKNLISEVAEKSIIDFWDSQNMPK